MSYTAQAQIPYYGGTQGMRGADVKSDRGAQRNMVVTVLNDAKKKLDRQSIIELHDLKRNTNVYLTTGGESDAQFDDLDFGDYELKISAVGYITQVKQIHVTATIDSLKEEIVLEKDPTAVDLKLADEGLPPNARKDAGKALYALKSGNWKEAQKRLEKVYPLAPTNAEINFLYGYLYLQLKDLDKSESYLAKSASLDSRRIQALTLLGRVQLQREHYDDAAKTLEHAITEDPNSWNAHSLLADAYLKQKKYDKAREQAQAALAVGKEAASAAQLPLGEALANLGRDKEALEALQGFIKDRPNDPTIPQVKDFMSKVEKRDKELSEVKPGSDLLLAASEPSLPPSAWGPPGVDDVKPQTVVGVPCPTDQMIEVSGERVKQLVDSISQFAAVEDLLHEQLDPNGAPLTKETRKFDYVATISEPKPGYLATEEFRNTHYGLDDLPDRIVSSGFVSLALIFHPDMRDNFEMTCEGLGDWHGQATWLVHFKQRDDKPSRLSELVINGNTYPINLKGRAWITADSFQIVRIESELMNHVPVLAVQHQIAEYGPVHFKNGNVDLWLPKSVDLYFELNKHRYYRRHSFDHYMLFAINSQDKQGAPKNQQQPADQPKPPSAEGAKSPSM